MHTQKWEIEKEQTRKHFSLSRSLRLLAILFVLLLPRPKGILELYVPVLDGNISAVKFSHEILLLALELCWMMSFSFSFALSMWYFSFSTLELDVCVGKEEFSNANFSPSVGRERESFRTRNDHHYRKRREQKDRKERKMGDELDERGREEEGRRNLLFMCKLLKLQMTAAHHTNE